MPHSTPGFILELNRGKLGGQVEQSLPLKEESQLVAAFLPLKQCIAWCICPLLQYGRSANVYTFLPGSE